VLQAVIQSGVLTIGSKTGIYNSSNRLAVTRLTRVLSASGQNGIGADKGESEAAFDQATVPDLILAKFQTCYVNASARLLLSRTSRLERVRHAAQRNCPK
jgi:hypothetical protein